MCPVLGESSCGADGDMVHQQVVGTGHFLEWERGGGCSCGPTHPPPPGVKAKAQSNPPCPPRSACADKAIVLIMHILFTSNQVLVCVGVPVWLFDVQ